MKKVSVGILLRNGTVLACQRRPDARYALKWEFPGGKVEDGESFEQTLIREIHEELSIRINGGEEFFHQQWTYPDSASERNATGTYSVKYFLVRHFEGDPVNNAFHRIRWVAPSELQTMDILEGNAEAVRRLILHEHQNRSKGQPYRKT
ncbi:MAG: (deoxy)nucleoside triphosphate pyrophosphohydrolase [Ignavibacteria bacterium]|nr:(deoxy)nucleoside triphosphate pyrophosphohydrolase [Ignavibacteria bacterium]